MSEQFRKRPPRLRFVTQQHQTPLYFVTFNTWHRRKLLANPHVYDAFVAYAEENAKHGRAIGKFIIMPDHLHLFARLEPDFRLSEFIRLLKRSLSVAIHAENSEIRIWQPGFFDHMLRNDESYAQKWNYVNDNPVRKKLVEHAEDWPWAGEIVRIDRA